MIFNTPWFFAFFAVFYSVLCLLPGRQIRFYFLLGACALFHAHFAGAAGVAPIAVCAALVYLIAIRLAAAQGRLRRAWFWLGLSLPIGALIYYKYRGLLFSGGSGALPLAISFFTFEFVHYLVDVYQGAEPIRSLPRFGLFCIYFPSIVSGPIKRYEGFDAQLESGLGSPWASGMALEGLAQALLGFFKKLVVADTAAQLIKLLEERGGWERGPLCLLILLLGIRILFDFSGYSDIAIGLSKMIGLRLPANFNFPYLALNPSDFWRRWHMSLSSWIRDYVYIPLGGSRHGLFRQAAGAMLAMLLCGLWHGAAWHFGAWGLYHGLGLLAHAAWRRQVPSPASPGLLRLGLSWAACMLFVGYGWLLFFYPLAELARMTGILWGGSAS